MKALKIEGLHFTYPAGVKALKGIDLEIDQGESIGIIGENGAGKTTLVKHFNGLLKPTEGKAHVMGKDTQEKSIRELSQVCGYVFQNPQNQIFQNRIFDEVAFGPRNMGFSEDKVRKKVKKALKEVELWDKKEDHPYDVNYNKRKLIAIASIRAMDTDIFILDEPTTAQDPKHKRIASSIIDKLLEEGKTVVTISHDMEFIAHNTDRVFVLRDGNIMLRGKTPEVYSKPKELSKTFLEPPLITQLAQEFEDIPDDVLRVEEFYKHAKKKSG